LGCNVDVVVWNEKVDMIWSSISLKKWSGFGGALKNCKKAYVLSQSVTSKKNRAQYQWVGQTDRGTVGVTVRLGCKTNRPSL